jgi:hypothetical protein
MKESFNPCCGYVSNAAELVSRDSPPCQPQRGDIGVCINCGTLLVYCDGPLNKTQVATPLDLGRLTSEDRKLLFRAQCFISRRGRIVERRN